MIKIKDYIFNENEIEQMQQLEEYKIGGTMYNNVLWICLKSTEEHYVHNATFEDIEWNYKGNRTNEEDARSKQELIFQTNSLQSSLSNKLVRIEELEEENKRLELENEKHKSWVNSLNKDNHKFRNRIKELERNIADAWNYVEENIDDDVEASIYWLTLDDDEIEILKDKMYGRSDDND